jgi:hypothetical protein
MKGPSAPCMFPGVQGRNEPIFGMARDVTGYGPSPCRACVYSNYNTAGPLRWATVRRRHRDALASVRKRGLKLAGSMHGLPTTKPEPGRPSRWGWCPLCR